MSTTTLSSGLIVPDVWADMTHAEFLNRAIVGQSPAVNVRTDLEGVPGSKVSMPRWNPLTDMADLTEGAPMETEIMSQRFQEVSIKEAGKAIEVTDTADLTALGNTIDEAVRQFGILAARKVDADLIKAAVATVSNGITQSNGGARSSSQPLTADISGGLNWNGIADALEKFGDDYDPAEYAGLFIRSEQRSQIMKDETFIRASELSASGEGSMVTRGVIGQIAGLNVFVTDRIESGKALILKRNSLGLFHKRRPIVETDRDILKRTTVVATNMHYAVGRLNDRGVLALTIS